LTDAYTGSGMGLTAEKLAEQYDISRTEQDVYAMESNKRAEIAVDNGYFSEEIVPVEINKIKGKITNDENKNIKKKKNNKKINTSKIKITIDEDEHIKRNVSLEEMSKLRPAFRKEGSVTAGNSSGINDGAASLIIASEKAVNDNDLNPMAKIISWGI